MPLLRFIFGSALTTRDAAIARLQKRNRELSLYIALLEAKAVPHDQ